MLEATGVGFKLGPKDVAVRCNFCTLDAAGNITDRRAGRIPSEESAPLAIKLRQVKIPGVEVFVEPVKEHRFVVVFRGEGLGGNVADTDPQKTGVPPLDPVAADLQSQRTAEVAKQFVAQAQAILAGQPKANGLTMRGFSAAPHLPSYEEVYGLKAAAIAVYPMYKGLAQLVGMEVVGKPNTLAEEIDVLGAGVERLRFLLRPLQVHRQPRRGRQFRREGEDDRAVRRDRAAGDGLKPKVLIVTGDHSTPARLASHSWHPVPTLLVSDTCRPDGLQGLRRAQRPAGRAGPVRGRLPHAAGHGPRRKTGQIRGVINLGWHGYACVAMYSVWRTLAGGQSAFGGPENTPISWPAVIRLRRTGKYTYTYRRLLAQETCPSAVRLRRTVGDGHAQCMVDRDEPNVYRTILQIFLHQLYCLLTVLYY